MRTILLIALTLVLSRCDSHLFVFKVGETIMVNDSMSGEVVHWDKKSRVYKVMCGDSVYHYCSEYLDKFND